MATKEQKRQNDIDKVPQQDTNHIERVCQTKCLDENAATIEIVFAIGLKLAYIETKCRGTFVLK
ncbi:hypothetical protein GmHk_19G055886 [Glycine max]|nr:hypothetical protein GmHk_19G055886 [Glycine max]